MRKQQLIQPVFIALVLLVGAPAASGQESFRDRQIDARFALKGNHK